MPVRFDTNFAATVVYRRRSHFVVIEYLVAVRMCHALYSNQMEQAQSTRRKIVIRSFSVCMCVYIRSE